MEFNVQLILVSRFICLCVLLPINTSIVCSFVLSLSALWCVHSLCFSSSVPSFFARIAHFYSSLLLLYHLEFHNHPTSARLFIVVDINISFLYSSFFPLYFPVRSFGVLVLVLVCVSEFHYSFQRSALMHIVCVSVSVPFYLIFQIQSLSCTGLLLLRLPLPLMLVLCTFSMLSLKNLTSFPLLIPFYSIASAWRFLRSYSSFI